MDRIGEYLIQGLLGEGGMGKVYEAEERLSKRRVALKVLRPELSRSDEGRRLFLNEMTILAHLDHPHIVRCLACTETDGQLVMVLELLHGRTLRQVLLEHGRLAWSEAVRMAAEISSALSMAHGQTPPVVHRDLKPENVMVLEDGTLKVMDFGIAKVLEALSGSTTHSAGTLQYMSPEQIDASAIDHRSDLYSLGLVLYELLSGKPPFFSASPRELLNMQCTAAPPPLPDDVRASLPRGVESLLFALLEKRAEDRPASADAVLKTFEPFVPASAVPARTGGVASRVAGPTGTQPMAAKAGALSSAPVSPKTLESESGAKAGDTLIDPAGRADTTHDAVVKGHAAHPAVGGGGARADTVALIERVSAPREVSSRTALVVVLLASVIAGLVTFFVKRGSPSAQTPDTATERSAR
jgi:eukaryotic-like serine/threonine-protein kinase